MTPKLHRSITALLLTLLSATLSAQTPAPSGVKVTLDRYSGPATVSAVSLGKFKLRVQVERNSDAQPLNVRVELPATGRDTWPANDVEVRDEAGTALLVQRTGIEWEKLLVPIADKVGAFIVQAVEPPATVPRTSSDKDRVIQDAVSGAQVRIASKGGMGGGAAMNGLFKQRDKNNDGKLGADEIPSALFDRLDADKDGSVTEAELKALRQR